MEKQNLCNVVRDIPRGTARRRWTLRADYFGHHHAIVHLSESPLYLELLWRQSAGSQVRRVGIFCLDLSGLLRDGYIRPEAVDSQHGEVRLRIFRDNDGCFYVQKNQRSPRLLLPSRPD
jgi:hypothetical protein